MPLVVPNLDLAALAANQAQTKYGGQINQVNRNIGTQGITDQAAIDAINNWGQTGGGVIDRVYNELTGELTANKANQQGVFDRTLAANQQAYTDAINTQNAAKADTLAYLSRLGTSMGAGDQAIADQSSQLANTVDQMVGRTASYGANSTNDLRQWAANHIANLQSGINNAGAEKAQRLSGFQSQIAGLLSDAEMNKSTHQYNLQGMLSDLLGEQGSYNVDALAQLVAQQFQQQEAAARIGLEEQSQANQIAMHNADLAESQASRQQSAMQKQDDDSLGWARLAADIQQNGVSNQLNLAQFGLAQDELGLKYSNPQYSGQNGLLAYAKDHNVSPETLAAAQQYWNTGLTSNPSDPYGGAQVAFNSDFSQAKDAFDMGRGAAPIRLKDGSVRYLAPGAVTAPGAVSDIANLNPSTMLSLLSILGNRYGGRDFG